MHIFTHRSGAYLFDRADGEDWMAQHFFAGGMMPSHHLIRQYADLFEIEKEWALERHPLSTHRAPMASAISIPTATRSNAFFAMSTATNTSLWMRRWRWFFLATAGLFRLRRRHRMGRQPLQDESGVAAVVMPCTRAKYWIAPAFANEDS